MSGVALDRFCHKNDRFRFYVYNRSLREKGEPMQDILIFIQNHAMLVSAIVIVLIFLIIIEYVRQKKGARRISPQYATQLINHDNATLLDIRGSDAFASGHIVGALSIPLADLENKSKKLDKFKTNPLILVSATDVDSQRAANNLMKCGFNVFILAGGIRSWKEAELPLIKG